LKRRMIAAGVLSFALVHVASAQRLAKPVIDTINHHIVRVMNSGPAAWAGLNGWQLVLVTTVQPPDGQPGELINPDMRGPSLIWDDAERLVLVDAKPAAIKRYDATGRFLGQLGREGDGPGEYRNPAIAARGRRLVAHEQRSWIVKTWQNDIPGETWRAEAYFGGFPIYLDTLERFYNYTSLPDPVTHVLGQQAWLRWPASRWRGIDAPADTIRVPVHVHNPNATPWRLPTQGIVIKPFQPQNVSIIDHGGRMIWGDTKRSSWVVTPDGRDTLRIYQIADTAPQFKLSARDSLIRATADRNPRIRDEFLAMAKGSDLPDHLPAWREIVEDRSGNLWITRYGTDANVARFDVLDPTGRWLGSIVAPAHFGRTFAVGRDHIADLIEGDDGRPAMRIFRIDRRGH